MKKHLKLKIIGRVQGVAFRASTQRIAYENDIKGFVKNMDDGSVYAEFEGDDFQLKRIVDWCWKGPDMAEVNNVFIEEGPLQGFSSFRIQH